MMEMLHLWNRGLITEEVVTQALRESDVKDKYIPDLLKLRVYLPPPRSIVAMIRQGAISDDQARAFLTDAGVAPDVQEVFIKSGHHTAASAVKQISEEGTLSRSQAEGMLATAGWNATQATMLLDIADAALVHTEQQHVISGARSLYVKYRATRADTSITLDATGITSAQRDGLLKLWDIERTENKPQLTHTQITGAWRRSLVTTEWATAKLTALGYAADEVPILLLESIPPTKFPLPDPSALVHLVHSGG
jgi:hypothetical protein